MFDPGVTFLSADENGDMVRAVFASLIADLHKSSIIEVIPSLKEQPSET